MLLKREGGGGISLMLVANGVYIGAVLVAMVGGLVGRLSGHRIRDSWTVSRVGRSLDEPLSTLGYSSKMRVIVCVD